MKLIKSKKWLDHDFFAETGPYESENMKQFRRDFKSDLKKALKPVSWKVYELKPNHFDITAVLSNEDETKFIYLSISDMRWLRKSFDNNVLIRTMSNSKDWTGGHNNFINLKNLEDTIERLAA